MKCNVDGCSKRNPGIESVGGMIRDCRGNIILGYYKKLGIKSNNYAEKMAMCYGIVILQTYEVENIVMEGDSKLIRDILQKKTKCPWNQKSLISDRRRKMISLKKVIIPHTLR